MLTSSSEYFQISAAAAGITRNGVINKVRASARPLNSRSSSTASSKPSSSDRIIEPPTMRMVAQIEGRNAPFVITAT